MEQLLKLQFFEDCGINADGKKSQEEISDEMKKKFIWKEGFKAWLNRKDNGDTEDDSYHFSYKRPFCTKVDILLLDKDPYEKSRVGAQGLDEVHRARETQGEEENHQNDEVKLNAINSFIELGAKNCDEDAENYSGDDIFWIVDPKIEPWESHEENQNSTEDTDSSVF